MLQLPRPLYRKPRWHPRRMPPAAPPALALVSLTIESIDGADAHLRLVFNTTADNPLNNVSLAAAAKWTARYDGVTYEGFTLLNDTFDALTLHLQGGAAEAGPNVLNYSNAPSDVADASGRQLAAFSGFPL